MGFDEVYAPGVSQLQVYDSSARRATMDFINGFNATVIVFGQTGSGKTFTMFGPDKPKSSNEAGVVPRALKEVLAVMEDRKSTVDATLAISCVEVYGSEISDLLKGGVAVGQS